MTLGGLWHGAAAHYIAWGVFHGLALVVERVLGMDGRSRSRGRAVEFGWFGLTQFGVLLSWLVFRAEDLPQAETLFANLWQLDFSLPATLPLGWSLLVASPVIVMHLRTAAVERLGLPEPGTAERGLITGILLYLCLTANGVNDAFIYFQF